MLTKVHKCVTTKFNHTQTAPNLMKKISLTEDGVYGKPKFLNIGWEWGGDVDTHPAPEPTYSKLLSYPCIY